MATYTYKVLGQSNPSAASLTTLYTVPASTSSVISSITIANRSSTQTFFRIAIRPGGAAISNEHYLAYDISIDGNSLISLTLGVTISSGDVVSVYATDATLSFGVFGSEITA